MKALLVGLTLAAATYFGVDLTQDTTDEILQSFDFMEWLDEQAALVDDSEVSW